MCFEMTVDWEDDHLKCNISDAMHCKRQEYKTTADNELTTFSCDLMNIAHIFNYLYTNNFSNLSYGN